MSEAESTKTWWLKIVCVKNQVKPVIDVLPFASKEAAEEYRQKAKPEFGMPNSISIAFQADTREEALEKMDRY